MSNGYDTSKLFCVRVTSNGIQAACPVCRENNQDKTGNHLKIFNNGSFHCIVGSDSDPDHNRRIYQLLRDPNAEVIQFIDPEPTRGAHVEKVYPESSLDKLIKDFSYWANRGISEEVQRKLEIGVAPKEEKSKLSGRVIMPIRDIDSGQIVGFSGRLIENNSFAPKYKHVFKASRSVAPWLVNGNEIKNKKRVILCESAGDLMSLMTHDINECLCIFGLNLNGRIISTLIANDIRHIILSLNRDEDPSKGQAAMEKIKKKLLNFWTEDRIIIRLPPKGYKDWNEVCQDKERAPEEFMKFKKELEGL